MKRQTQKKLSVCKINIAKINSADTFQIKGGTLTDLTGANHGCTDGCPTLLATEASCGCKL
ncbi:hypothetical protein [uncultured Kordia sp.]|uniref:hypothetical protein n=1 Tax=uncultured Kordia sp. TaxID=507699 RepID=UPI00260A697E|nr:hypothetical protein [uncultured Kordia sp.]